MSAYILFPVFGHMNKECKELQLLELAQVCSIACAPKGWPSQIEEDHISIMSVVNRRPLSCTGGGPSGSLVTNNFSANRDVTHRQRSTQYQTYFPSPNVSQRT